MQLSRHGTGTACRQGISRHRFIIKAASNPQGPAPKPPTQSSSTRAGHSVRTAAQLSVEERLTLQGGWNPNFQGEAYPRTGVRTTTVPAPPDTDTPMAWVFSYGGNMCCETLARRDVSVATRDPAFVVDPSVRLVFKHRGGHATIEAMPKGHNPRFRPPGLEASQGQPCVHGVLYRMPAADLKLMESRDMGYVLTQMDVETYEGVRVSANVWVSGALTRLPQEVVPPELYMRNLREGAAFNFLDPAYQAWLSSIETVTSAGLGSEYYNTPGRYISYSLLMVSLTIVAGWLSQHL